jgi:hypothetical protein
MPKEIISLETSLEYESNGMCFETYISYFVVDQINGQNFLESRNGLINWYGVSTMFFLAFFPINDQMLHLKNG